MESRSKNFGLRTSLRIYLTEVSKSWMTSKESFDVYAGLMGIFFSVFAYEIYFAQTSEKTLNHMLLLL